MVKADDELSDLMHVQEHYRQITHRGTGAVLKVVAADNETVGGKKATGVLVDELWLFGKRPNAENMLREACGGLAARPEGFVIYLSTQSDEAPAGVFKQKLDYARGVRDGRIDDRKFLPVIYEFPDSILKETTQAKPPRPIDQKYFYVTNPNLGASVDEEYITRESKKAEEAGIESMQGFLAKHLNVEMGLALKTQRWAGADFWEDAAGTVTLEIILERSEVVVIGIDGGGLDDLLGLSVLGRDAETRNWLLFIRAWAHPVALERRKSEAARYRDFERDGDLTIVDEIGQDVQQVGDIVMKCEDAGLLDRIGVDPVGIGDVVDEIEARELAKISPNSKENDRIVGISQGWRLSGAIKTLERRLAEKTIMHSGSALMSWCVGNARVEPRGNAILITKQASGTGKIDPLMATFNAVALMAMNPEARRVKSIYETEGVKVF
jgi:phage terminase large subunit-like protein